jgi:ferritin-like metal-binding protein YciE
MRQVDGTTRLAIGAKFVLDEFDELHRAANGAFRTSVPIWELRFRPLSLVDAAPLRSTTMDNLQDMFVETLKDVYFAENAIIKALPKMAEKAESEDLKSALEEHLEETKGQVTRLEKIFKSLGTKAEGKECPALKGLVEETEEFMSEASAQVMDAGLIGCAQAVEHYEMARYGTLKAWAEQLELDDAVELLDDTLEEEKAADEKLTDLALAGLNREADDEDDEDEDEDEDKPKRQSRNK